MLQHTDDLSLLQAQIEYKKKLTAVMRELTVQEEALKDRISGLKSPMEQTQKDVDRLSGNSLSAFFYHVTGQMDSVLTKERREAYAARVKYDAAIRELEAIQEDIRETDQDLQDLQDCEARFAEQLERKRQELAQMPDHGGPLLLEKQQMLQYFSQQEQELKEAISAGTAALRIMADIQQSLSRARDWSSHDTRIPSFWTDHARQDRIGQAQENLHLFQIQLQKFNKELSDVTIRPNLQVSIDRMLQFGDSLYSQLTSDLSVEEGIRQSYTLSSQTREHILSVLRQLQNALEEVRHQQNHLRQEMDTIVLRTINE